jgi:hypothetical protein
MLFLAPLRTYNEVCMKLSLLFLLTTLIASPLGAAERTDGPTPAYLDHLACRIASRGTGPSPVIAALADVQLKTMSDQPEERSFQARLHNGQQLTATVQHVYVRLPRDRFNVTMLLDGKPHLRLNHLDLDIFAETTVDGQAYLLHCFRDFKRDKNEPGGER